MTETRKLRVFLCHSSQDKPIARELYQRLNAEGWIDSWLDEEKLLPGQDWDLEIEKAVEFADSVIVCLSDSSVKKEGYIQKELRFALNIALEKPEETIFIIPLRVDECFIPRSLKSIHFIDFFPTHKKDQVYRRILLSLRNRAEAIGIDISKSQANIEVSKDESELINWFRSINNSSTNLINKSLDEELLSQSVKSIIETVRLGNIYTGTVKRIENYGAFVEILPDIVGLIHISQLSSTFLNAVEDVCVLGDALTVMVVDIDVRGKIRLSRRAVLEGWSLEDYREYKDRRKL